MASSYQFLPWSPATPMECLDSGTSRQKHAERQQQQTTSNKQHYHHHHQIYRQYLNDQHGLIIQSIKDQLDRDWSSSMSKVHYGAFYVLIKGAGKGAGIFTHLH